MTCSFLPNLKLYMWEPKWRGGFSFMLRACGWDSPVGVVRRCSFHFNLPTLCVTERILVVEVWPAQGHLTSSVGTPPDPGLLSHLSGPPQTAAPSLHFTSSRAYRCLHMTLFTVQTTEEGCPWKPFGDEPSSSWIRNNDTDCQAKIEPVYHWNNSKSYFCGKHPLW